MIKACLVGRFVMKSYLKKIIIPVLAVVIAALAVFAVGAFDDVTSDSPYYNAINSLHQKKVVAGVSETEFAPDAKVTRWQMALFVSRASTAITSDARWSEGAPIFADCTEYLGAIQYAYTNGIIKGVDETHFAPNSNITLRDGLIMAVRALGYEKEDEGVADDAKKYNVSGADYWKPYYMTAYDIGLLENLNTLELTKALSRAETAQLIYNMLRAKLYDSEFTMQEKVFEGKKEDTAKNRIPAFIIETPNQNFGDDTIAEDEELVQIEYCDGKNTGRIYVDFDKLSDSFIDIYDIEKYFGAYVELVNCPVKKTGSDELDYGKFEQIENIDTGNNYFCNDAEISYFEDEDRIRIEGRVYYLDSESSRGIELYTPDTKGEEYVEIDFYNDFAGKKFDAQFIDTDLDGAYEYGIILPLNVAKYSETYSSYETCGIMKKAGAKQSYYISRPEVGAIFAYTYNSLLNTVNVGGELVEKIGIVSGVSKKTEKDYLGREVENVSVVIDGTTYKVPVNTFEDMYSHVESITGYEFDLSADALTDAAAGFIGKSVEYYVLGDILVGFGEEAEEEADKFLVFSDVLTDKIGSEIPAEVYIDGEIKVINIGSVRIDGTKYNVNKLTNSKKKDLINKLGGLYTYKIDEDLVYHITEYTELYELSKYITNSDSLVFNAMVAEDYRSRVKAIRIDENTKIYVNDLTTGEVELIKPKPYGVFAVSIDPDTMFYADKIGYGSLDDGHGIASILYLTTLGESVDYAKYKIVYVMDSVPAKEIGYAEEFGLVADEESDVYTKFDTSDSAYVVSTLAGVEEMYVADSQSVLGEGLYIIDSNGIVANYTAKEDLKLGEDWIDISDGNSMLYKVVEIDPEDIDLYGYSSILIRGIDLLETNYIYKVRFNFKYIVDDEIVIDTRENRNLVDFLKKLRDEEGIESVRVLVVPNRYNNFEIVGTYPGNAMCGIVLDPVEISE